MKSIKLTAAKEKVGGMEVVITTYDLLHSSLTQTPKEGYTVEEMRSRFKLLDILEKWKENFTPLPEVRDVKPEFLSQEYTMELEDTDFEKLKNIVMKMRWGVLSRFIEKTINQFE